MNVKKIVASILLATLLPTNGYGVAQAVGNMEQQSKSVQKRINRVQLMPDMPEPFVMKDWTQLTTKYDDYVFDFTKEGEYLPVGWWDETSYNLDKDTFGLMSYVGKFSQGKDGSQEAINLMAAVLSATLVGVDKSNQNGHNYVEMLQTFYNTDSGENLLLNNPDGLSGQSFWYELLPHVLFYGLVDSYPEVNQMEEIMKVTADRWYDAAYELGGKYGRTDFNFTAFNFDKMEPFTNYKWTEPDAAAGVALIQYWAYEKFGDPKYLQAAQWCMDFLERQDENPMYEVLTYFMPYLAARMNVETGSQYDVQKYIDWIFNGGSVVRDGWGVMADRWGEYDVHGLMGSLTDNDGYAFAMNTFAAFGALAPLVRYDARYASDIGKWMLNVANNSRLFYASDIPTELQSGAGWKGDPEHVIPYEGLRHTYDGKTPYASGDPTVYYWGNTDFSLYSGSYVGFLGGLIEQTNVEGILRIDCLKTDYFHRDAYPTYLYYNPHDKAQEVIVTDLGEQAVHLYDTVSRSFVVKNVKGKAKVVIPSDEAMVLVTVPADAKVKTVKSEVVMNDVFVAPEPALAVNILGLQHNQLIQGDMPIDLEAISPDKDAIEKVRITFADQEVYSGSTIPDSYMIDTTQFANGFHDLKIIATTKGGIEDSASVQVLIRNEGGQSILSANTEEIAQWQSIDQMPGKVELVDNVAFVTENNDDGGYGGVQSESFKLDFNRRPIAVVDVKSVSAKWALQVHVDGEEWGFYVKPDGPETGYFVIDMMKEMRNRHSDLPYIGEQDVELWLITANGEGSTVSVDRIDLFYQDEPVMESDQWQGKHEAVELLSWQPIGSKRGTVVVDGDHAIIREDNILNSGGIASPKLRMDFSKEPIVKLDVAETSSNWSLVVYREGHQAADVIQPTTAEVGVLTYDLRKVMNTSDASKPVEGMENVQLWLVAEGDDKANLSVNSLELQYKKQSQRTLYICAAAIILVGIAIYMVARRRRHKK